MLYNVGRWTEFRIGSVRKVVVNMVQGFHKRVVISPLAEAYSLSLEAMFR
jgi:hypothetical protein